VLLPEIERSADAEVLAAAVLAVLAEPITVGSTTVTLTASIGAAVYPIDGSDADRLLRIADGAMYRAKLERNRVVFAASARFGAH
jgi:diguanylate cyclase (GGDEF)-like protein